MCVRIVVLQQFVVQQMRGENMKTYDILVETKQLHRLESTGENEHEALMKALDILNEDVTLSNSNISYNVMDILLKDEYV